MSGFKIKSIVSSPLAADIFKSISIYLNDGIDARAQQTNWLRMQPQYLPARSLSASRQLVSHRRDRSLLR
jgi:hypothetical protein